MSFDQLKVQLRETPSLSFVNSVFYVTCSEAGLRLSANC